jgi:uncharacterized protein with PQ loop repeat
VLPWVSSIPDCEISCSGRLLTSSSARIPQIIKNYQEKSCSGLALLFFLLSLMGNATYGASILSHSVEKEYIWNNLPWLIGSLGTMAEDAIIFVQFRMYQTKPETSSAIEG